MQAVIARRYAFGGERNAYRTSCDDLPEQGNRSLVTAWWYVRSMRFRNFRQVTRVQQPRGQRYPTALLSTAAGVQRASGKPTLAYRGDSLSALYHLNALALLRQVSAPLVLIVVNNNGGKFSRCRQRRKRSVSVSI